MALYRLLANEGRWPISISLACGRGPLGLRYRGLFGILYRQTAVQPPPSDVDAASTGGTI